MNTSIDILDIESRERVLNLFVFPFLYEDKSIRSYFTKENNCMMVEYSFMTNFFLFKYISNVERIKKEYYSKELGSQMYQNHVVPILRNGGDKIYICVFYFSPQGNWNPSFYSFDRNVILCSSKTLIVGNPPATSEVNLWFNDKCLRFDMERITRRDKIENGSLFKDAKGNPIVIIRSDKTFKTFYLGNDRVDDFYDSLKRHIVSVETMDFIKKEIENDYNTIILCVENYLKRYFLIARYVLSEDEITLEYIPSPGDDSLKKYSPPLEKSVPSPKSSPTSSSIKCKVILKNGRRKGLVCGRIKCHYHP